MSKYKVGDKVVLTVTSTNEMGCLPCYVLNDDLILSKQDIDKYAEPLSTYTEPLETKIRRQAAEITRLLEENKRLKAENGNSLWNIEQARAEGAEAAWELARKIAVVLEEGGWSSRELIEIFNTASVSEIFDLTYPEAAAKVEAWKKAKEEIKVGDVYESNIGSRCFVIHNIDEETNDVEILWIDLAPGNRGIGEIKHYKKTGRHMDIDSFLKQIGGENDEK